MSEDTAHIRGVMSHDRAEALDIRVTAKDSRSFERALCRRLVALGHTGRLELMDAATGKPRLVFQDIVKAAEKEAVETSVRGPHYIGYKESDFSRLRAA